MRRRRHGRGGPLRGVLSPPGTAPVLIRDARDDDADGLIELLGGVFAEYPNCVLDVDGEMPELRAVATAFARLGGRFWVGERGGRVVGSIGFSPSAGGTGVELKKLYVEKSARETGLGGKLCALVEAEARARGAAYIELWSDTRFETAHRFYERRGWLRGDQTRELFDKSDTVEFYFRKPLE